MAKYYYWISVKCYIRGVEHNYDMTFEVKGDKFDITGFLLAKLEVKKKMYDHIKENEPSVKYQELVITGLSKIN